MSRVYFSALESDFARALAALFEAEGFETVTEPVPGIEYYIDLTDACVPGDDRRAGEGIDAEAAAEASAAQTHVF